ncbi:ATP-dependent helicase HrpB [Spongisporangium articulatum]|uniref:ATP-dependent helicase HrpB n=1 Tax=Spongisporangium articulatum TaxID=3362603 RepID=A0ABW8APG4_9ACTN
MLPGMSARAEAALPEPLPISAVLPDLVDRLTRAGAAVLVSPPGTGKTTLVPLALADALDDGARVVVAEPRRIAARAAARRMADLLGEPVGARVGYTVRGDSRTGAATRVEVVTTGVLVRRLERDAELPGVGAVVLDECHERHLDTDLAVAFALESRAALRPDLLVLATSATADADRLASLLDGPVIGADAPLFDVTPVWCPPAGPVDPPHGLRVDPRLLDHVASVVRRALSETSGDVLVFLPGAGEINGVATRLGAIDGVDVLRLHGRLSAADQDAALRPGARRRVVLASAVAESSLTVPGVRTVVDAGLARVPRTDLSRGLNGLATVRVSRSSAHQRAGRAGREAPGRVYRCWSEAEHARLPAHPDPEVAVADLCGFALALARWGDPDGASVPLLDVPPAASMAVARQTLQALGAVDDDGRVTDRGRRLATVGVHPRLARALLDGAGLVGGRRAAEVVAILADDALAGGTDDLAHAWRRLRDGHDRAATARWRAEVERLRPEEAGGPAVPDDLAAGLVAGLAYPERLARSRNSASGHFLMAGGTGAEAAPGSRLSTSAWLAVAVAQRQAGAPTARVRLAAVIDEATAREVGAHLLRLEEEVAWVDGDVVAREVERLGAITLTERPLRDPARELLAAALAEGLRREGLSLLTWTPGAAALRARLAFLHATLGEEWPAVTDDALLARIDDWLAPELSRARRRADLARVDTASALRRLLDHRQAARLDELAPERITVPSGSQLRVAYSQNLAEPDAPVLAVKLQEMFGARSGPRIGGGRVPVVLHLLSPAGRPAAVTSDLESFWPNGYPSVRAELRGRYPKHPWPADPTTAPPTARTKPPR